MNLERVRNICESQKYPRGLTGLTEDIGMSTTNLFRCLRNGVMQVGDIERVARALHMPVSIFFDDDVSAKAFEKDVKRPMMKVCGTAPEDSEQQYIEIRLRQLEKMLNGYPAPLKGSAVKSMLRRRIRRF